MLNLRSTLSSSPVVAVLRSPQAHRLFPVSLKLIEAGLLAVEITLTTPGALATIASLRAEVGERALIGAGTIRTAEQAQQAIDAGAQFVVSQVTDLQVHKVCERSGVPYLPGALTPNEIAAAWNLGVQAVKISPVAPVGGVQYIHELRGPMPDIPLMPTGGVEIDDVPRYLDAGAAIIGVSGHLVGDALSENGNLDALVSRTTRLVSLVRDHQARSIT